MDPNEGGKVNMEQAKESLELTEEDSEAVFRIAVPPHRAGEGSSFYEDFALRGIRVDRVETGLVVCTFKVPPRLTDELGIISKRLGQKGGYSGTIVLLRNKATGEVIAEGRHSLFRSYASKL